MEAKVKESRGWELLRALLEEKSQTELSAETSVPQSVLSQLLRLQALPSRRNANRLEKVGIKSTSWDHAPRRKKAA